MQTNIPPPQSKAELWQRAEQLAGQTLRQVATNLKIRVPENLLHHKGWIGQLVEQALGATAGSLAMPDFPALGIELKTLPLTAAHKPKETTFVCTIPLTSIHQEQWHTSLVLRKLSQVLWVPLEADPNIPLAERRILSPLLWSPSTEEETILRFDWEMLTEAITLGRLNELSARDGHWLHIRPKGANRKSLTWAFDEQGQRVQTLPRGFYLRTELTAHLLTNML